MYTLFFLPPRICRLTRSACLSTLKLFYRFQRLAQLTYVCTILCKLPVGRRVSARAARSARMETQGVGVQPLLQRTRNHYRLRNLLRPQQVVAPSLDPGFSRRFIPTRIPLPTKAMASILERRRSRPPPQLTTRIPSAIGDGRVITSVTIYHE